VGYLRARFVAALNQGVERFIWVLIIAVAVIAWSFLGDRITVRAWILALAVGLPVAAAGYLLLRWRRLPAIDELEELRADNERLRAEAELGQHYALHLSDALTTVQKVLTGAIPDVTGAVLIEQGMLEPARDFLMQRPDEDVRLSILVPDDAGANWFMQFAAGYRLESKHRFSLPIVGSFSRHAYESGEIQWSGDLQGDPRYTPHPQATRDYHSIISIPIFHGDEVVAVFNTDSTYRDAFPEADFVYLRILAGIVEVVWALVLMPRVGEAGDHDAAGHDDAAGL
jgi:hypothetical protein